MNSNKWKALYSTEVSWKDIERPITFFALSSNAKFQNIHLLLHILENPATFRGFASVGNQEAHKYNHDQNYDHDDDN